MMLYKYSSFPFSQDGVQPLKN